MTATDGNLSDCVSARAPCVRGDDGLALRIERACRLAVSGRGAARALAEWTKRFGLTEAEFQLLWRLRPACGDEIDQTALARALAFSPAQISATVERMRLQGWIAGRSTTGDRRRHYWQLSENGRELLNQMLCAAALLRYDPPAETEFVLNGGPAREAAA